MKKEYKIDIELESQLVEYFDEAEWYPFNSGASIDEYMNISDRLDSQLTNRSEYGFSQSSNSPTAECSRSIALEVLDAAEWNLELVIFLQRFLSGIRESYCLLVTDSLEDRILGGAFLLLYSDKVVHWFRDPEECDAFWSGEQFSDPQGIGKLWSSSGWVLP